MMVCVFFFFFNDTATTEIYTYGHTRSLHDALPISEQGTGIGLVVCKRLIEWMGGAIGVESTPGTGSVFWVDLLRTAQVQPGVGSAQAEPAMAVASHVQGSRSAENTSEFQSLMRISYVVFCMKTTKMIM